VVHFLVVLRGVTASLLVQPSLAGNLNSSDQEETINIKDSPFHIDYQYGCIKTKSLYFHCFIPVLPKNPTKI